jgi:hypothetical protein
MRTTAAQDDTPVDKEFSNYLLTYADHDARDCSSVEE